MAVRPTIRASTTMSQDNNKHKKTNHRNNNNHKTLNNKNDSSDKTNHKSNNKHHSDKKTRAPTVGLRITPATGIATITRAPSTTTQTSKTAKTTTTIKTQIVTNALRATTIGAAIFTRAPTAKATGTTVTHRKSKQPQLQRQDQPQVAYSKNCKINNPVSITEIKDSSTTWGAVTITLRAYIYLIYFF